jgi:hypothetical protein
LDGGRACSGGVVFASEMLFSMITAVMTVYVAIQQSISRQGNFDESGE